MFKNIVILFMGILLVAGCGKKEAPVEEVTMEVPLDKLEQININESAPGNIPGGVTSVVNPNSEPAKLPAGVMALVDPNRPTEVGIQVALVKSGYYNGSVDGKIGPMTEKAIKNFQTANGLKSDGVVGPKTWQALKKYLDTDVSEVPVKEMPVVVDNL